MLELIAYDIGGILANINKKPLAELLGGNHQLDKFFDDNFWAYQRGLITSEVFINSKSLQFDISFSIIQHTFQHMIRPKNIKILSGSALPYIFFSNINQLHFEFFIHHITVPAFTLKYSLTSYQLGQLKPHRVFFDKLGSILDIDRSNILVIDDQVNNLAAAIHHGFKAQANLALE